jgi:hypothetical protein
LIVNPKIEQVFVKMCRRKKRRKRRRMRGVREID